MAGAGATQGTVPRVSQKTQTQYSCGLEPCHTVCASCAGCVFQLEIATHDLDEQAVSGSLHFTDFKLCFLPMFRRYLPC
jgi:hypothetical protein